jgi:hypothetical protein
MPAINDEGLSLLELSDSTDFVTDGPARIEVLREDTARIVYFYWQYMDGVWRRVASKYARLCPISSLTFPIGSIPGVPVVTRTPAQHFGLHS